ncbi:MAG TPA: DnaT-like ssDNA-binding protein [Phycisphaerae bacterium]|nr:DnaT-like ssDNA-binding protein [Phycisphaerae bacterium]
MGGSGTGTPWGGSAVLVVEDGTGLATANSYASVVAADTYHTAVTRSTDWSLAALSVKENALIVATQYLDIEYEGRWRGRKASSTQALSWPRVGGVDNDSYAIEWNAVPENLKRACAELALRVVLGDELLGVVAQPGDVASESKSLGPLSKSVTYVAGRPAGGKQYPKVESLLKPLLEVSGRVYRA